MGLVKSKKEVKELDIKASIEMDEIPVINWDQTGSSVIMNHGEGRVEFAGIDDNKRQNSYCFWVFHYWKYSTSTFFS